MQPYKGDSASHWEAHLAGVAPCHFPRLGATAVGPKRPMTIKVNLDQTQQLKILCDANTAALPAALRAAWSLVLLCYTGAEDVCFGYQDSATSSVLPVARLALADETLLSALVETAQAEYESSLPFHGDVPETATGSVEQRLYNTVVSFRSAGKPGMAPASRAANVALPENCRIRLMTKLINGRMSIFLEWWSVDMTMEQAMGVASTVGKAITAVTASPAISVGAFDPITPLHLKQIMKWNDYPLKPVDRCIHEVIHDQAVRRPDAEAVCAWDGGFTYKALDHVTSQLAEKLVELGVGPEVRVPLCFDKSKWNVVAMLSVMKAGGAFVPFDPTHPIPRLQGLAKTLEASLLLCSAHHAARLAPVAASLLAVDDALVQGLPAVPDATRLASRAKPNNAAYVIFTSGSTGEPKGTLLEHAAYCASAAAHGGPLGTHENSRNLQFAAHTFDASLVEILTPLMYGACVCIPSEDARLNNIAGAINDQRITVATLTPSFIGFINPSDVPGLETLVLAGEAMSQSHIDTWSKINLVNGFGPTETSVACAIRTNVTATTDPKDIGFPVGGYCWVVNADDHDRLVPPGCVGELLVEGPTLARGYLNNLQKTTDAFILDPVWSRSATTTSDAPRRFYKTGDLVRYNSPQGSFYYVGRKDTQVKFHGQRVELGEIEHYLNLAPNVKHGLVLLPKTGNCKGKLVSIVSFSDEVTRKLADKPTALQLVNAGGKGEHLEHIRESMAARLPSYMVPSIWVCMEELPLLASTKLDRKTVAKWVDAMPDDVYHDISGAQEAALDGAETSKPENAVEAKVQSVWSHILNIPLNRIGMDQSFLSLGGDSITAMTCMGQCKKAGLGFTVHEILRSKSIRALAACAKTVKRTADLTEEVNVDFELQPIQQYHFTVRREEQGHFNQSFFLRLSKQTEQKALRIAVDALLERHSMLRSRFRQSGPNGEWKQYITKDIESSCRFKCHTVRSKEDTYPAIAASQAGLNAVEGPLFAVDLFDVDDGLQLLSMIGHHLVIDLVSWRVILEDLEDLLTNPTNPSLNDKSIPFQTWAKLQSDHCQNLSLSHVLPMDNIPSANFAYWGTEVDDNVYGASAAEGFDIDAATTSLILTECHNGLRTEPIDLFVSVLIHSFGQTFTDREPPAIYNEGHGREIWDESIDIARTVGWFTTVYPIFIPTTTSKDLVDITKRVKDIRRAVPGNGRPYFATRWLTEKGRETWKHHAPMELSFNYLGQYQQLEREGALLNPVDGMAGEAKEAGGNADYAIGTPRFGLFEISAVVAAGKLRFSFTFNRHMKHQSSIRQWISHCRESLQNAPRLFSRMSHTPTLSDYPLLKLNYDSLNSMIKDKLPLVGAKDAQDIEDAYPCSPMQQGLLLSRSKDGAYYAVNGTYEVKPKSTTLVNADKLAAAWNLVVRRHACLRTVFIEGLSSDGLYDQVVLKMSPSGPSRLHCTKESDVLATLSNQGLMQYTDHSPANRFTICETSNGKVFCRLELSHAVMDGTSMSIIFEDLCRAYAGEIKDESGPLFSSYVAYLQSLSLTEGIAFWKSYLDGLDPCHFPVLNDGITLKKELHNLRLEFKELQNLQKFCDTEGLTLSNAIHTAWALTLRSFVGVEDICFGYLSSGRDAPVPGANAAVGPFINMLVCRVKMPGDASLLSVLEQVQKDYMDSLPFKHTSLAEVQHALKLSDTSLFNTCVSYRKLPPLNKKKPIISFDEFSPTHDPDEYPVSINIEASDEIVAIDLDYWTDSICDKQGRNIASSFIRSLENITHNAHNQISQLDNLSSLDYDNIWNWNRQIPITIPDCVHYVIEKQTALRPDAQAICGFDASFTYKELDVVSSRLASYLVALGVTPETFVPTCFDKSAYTVVSMLAVLKAGGACVPLDATHPMPALETRVVDTEAQIVVASATRAAMFDDMVPYVVAVDAEFLEQLPSYGEENEIPAIPSNPAFVIFTSGSTGKPKGVVLEHSAMVTSAEAHGSALGVGPDTRFLQFATYTFDNSLEEMFTTLMRGGCVCVPSEDDRFNDLAGAIDRLDANFMDLTPTVATFIKPADVPKIKAMAIGGEALTKKAQEIWGSSIQMHNQYGPSECSINCAHNGEAGTVEDVSNIGRSVGSVSWVVDPNDHNKLVPVGCVGELCVEGPIVARGYLNDPEKTAKSFVENPTWATRDPHDREFTTRRMYKTGDLVRYNSDGSMAFLGRKDTQVKFNGQRIELGEIEYHVKNNLPEGAQSAVQLVLSAGTKALAAFLCLEATTDADTEDTILPMTASFQALAKELESSVTKSLPVYMVPSIYIPVARMPMTSSGKLDRRTLSTWANALSDEAAVLYRLGGMGGRDPKTPSEKILQSLWAAVLSKPAESIGADDSFFRHGGDSIGAMKLVAAARAKGVMLSVAKIFSTPKLSEMACTFSLDAPSSDVHSKDVCAQPSKRFELLPPNTNIQSLLDEVTSVCQVDSTLIHDMYPCTSLQGGLVALSSKAPGSYVAQNTFRLSRDIDIGKFRKAWQLVADSEVVLRTRVVFTDLAGFVQVVVNEPIEWHSVARLSDIQDKDRHLPPYDGGPLASYTIVGERSSSPYFVWTAHHALYDGWSIPTLLERVASYYKNPSLAQTGPAASFTDFIKYLSTIDQKASNDFWISRLKNPKATPFPALPSASYKVQATSKTSHSAGVAKSQSRETTVASIIRAAWGLTMALNTTSDDVIFGEIMTGRDAPVPGIEDMIGPALTSVPTRVQLKREQTVTEFLNEMQSQLIETMPYQFAGLAQIKRLGNDAATSCEFQNAIAISQDADESADGFWDMVNSGSDNNFYTYPLTLSCILRQGKVDIEAFFDESIISSRRVDGLLRQFEILLFNLSLEENSQKKVGDIELIGSQELKGQDLNHQPANPTRQLTEEAGFPSKPQSQPDSSSKFAEPLSQSDVCDLLWKVWSQILNLPEDDVDLSSSFLHLGGDSISAMQVTARCRSQGITASVQNIMQSDSITDLATRVKFTKKVPTTVTKGSELVESGKPFKLSPIQQVYLDNAGGNWRQFNQSLLLKVTKRKSNETICRAMHELVNLHPMLHARFQTNKNGEWRQRVSNDIDGSLRMRSHSDARRSQMGSLIEESQQSLDIENGPLVAADLFNLPGCETQISIAIHHLVVDVVSWGIILQDFEDLLNGKTLTRHDLSFELWCKHQAKNAQDDSLDHVLPANDIPAADFSYWGMLNKPNVFGDALVEELDLDTETTSRILDACQKSLNADLVDVLLATVLLSFRQEFTDRRVPPPVFNEGHGREPWDSSCDPSTIVGWFTTLCPVYLPADADTDAGNAFIDSVRWVQEFRSRTPGKGRPYFAYRQLAETGKTSLKDHWPMEIAFNYLGQMQVNDQMDSLLEPVDGAGGQSINTLSDIGPDVRRFALIEISAVVSQGALKLSFTYNKHMQRRQDIKNWFSKCQSLLEGTSQLVQRVSHTKFPLLPLTYGCSSKIAEELPALGLKSLDDVETAYLISPMQRGILISQLKDAQKYAYHSIFEVKSNQRNHRIDLSRLEAAWQEVVSRHTSLRTVFIDSVSGNNLMDQVVLKKFHARTLIRRPSVEEYQAALEDLEPLDYTQRQPPHRFTLCQLPSGRVICKLEISHAISDGSSMMILLNDLSMAYDSTSTIGVAMPYSDFITHLQLTPKRAGVDYWKRYLDGLEPCTLPSLAAVPPPKERKVGEYSLKLDIGAELQTFCRREGLTQSNVLQLVWGLVLRAYTGSDEVCFGYVASGRDLPIDGIQEAVGAFINMLICRLNLLNNSVLIDVLQKTRADYMEGIGHQNCSLAEVQHELGLGDTALFNTVFTFQKRLGTDGSEEMALSFESLKAIDPNEFNMSINIAAIDSYLEIDFGYWSDTVSDAHAKNIAHTFKQILKDIIENGTDRPLGEIDLFGEDSCQQVRSWNAQSPQVVNKCVHEIIEEQTMLRPRSALAICAWDATFTYSELDAVASRVAAHLMDLGVGPDVYVPLCFEKSGWAIVAQLSILKAGGAFVSLDPSHPDQRLANLIEDVGAKVVLCSPNLHHRIMKIAKTTVVVDSNTVQRFPKQPAKEPETYVEPSNAAYVIFTSGTTGKPKGTVIEHAAICTGSAAHGKALLMESSSRVLQFASYTFDASVTEILTALQVGATICVPSDEERMNDLQDMIAKRKVNWTLLTPSVLSTLKPEDVPTLKTIVTGGEAMSEKAIKEWVGGPAVVNAYGPTEASVVASASLKVSKAGVSVDQNRSNIGTACGCRTWIVDPRNIDRLMPVGAVGELLIEGRTVARGYINNPEKTNEVFLSSPEFSRDRRFRGLFSQRHRMYRSGDLVRYNTDGSINYISRKDTQIKLNGQRIELGEIEYHCKVNLPDQTQAGVDLIVPSDRAKKTLAVFFSVPADTTTVSTLTNIDGSPADELIVPMDDTIRALAKSLETKLGSSIPTYMVPHLFIPMSKLPWSAAGKLDRNRLRNITQQLSRESIKSFRLSGVSSKRNITTGIGRKLQSMWEIVLNLPKGAVGANDSFFRLGGDSLAAMQLSGAARQQGITLSFANIFKHPILADMASTCVALNESQQKQIKPFSLLKQAESVEMIKTEVSKLCRVNSELIADIYPCSSLQEGLIALSLKQPGAYVAQNVFKLSPDVNIEKFKAAWQKTVDDLTTLRTRIVHTASSDFLQVVSSQESIVWHSAENLQDLSGEAASVPPFNGGSLTKYTIVEAAGSQYFAWCIHHALYDGWSLPLILQRVESIYRGEAPAAPDSSYANFINYLSTTDPIGTKNFWMTKLADVACSKFPPLPPTKDGSETRTVSRRISNVSVGGITLPTIIRAAWALVLAGHTASNDVCFGEILTGRNINVPGVADIVGPTLTTVPTRIQIDPKSSISNFLQNVQQGAADIVPYQHAGLQYIRRLNGDTSEACDFQNLLVIQTTEGSTRQDLWELQSNGDVNNFFTYPLVLECHLSPKDIAISVYHKEATISTWEVERLMGQFAFVMNQLSKKPLTSEIDTVELVCPEDKETINWWNRRKPIVVNECIHDIFNRIANSNPNDEASCDIDQKLTYAELQQYSSGFSKQVAAHGVKPDDFVPICVDKSVWTVVAIMGILMAGGAFVPLDPSHPSSRHQEIVQECGAKLVVCSPKYADRFSVFTKDVLTIDRSTNMTTIPNTPSTHSSKTDPSNAAYAIFTSGSTGKAKGIVIEHRAFASSSAAYTSTLCMRPDSRVFQFASVSFDASVMEILSTLTIGGCVCLPTEEERMTDISGAIRRMGVNWTFLTSSVANIIDPDTTPTLETLACGGEALSREVIIKWADKLRLINLYGPTEASVVATLNTKIYPETCIPSIGHGIQSTLTWIVDSRDHNRLAPLGAIGELALEGPTLAREYLNSPQKTAEGFPESPAWATQTSTGSQKPRRIHKTGDLVKYNASGDLEFFGRKDNQVKLNGQRMELGEIQSRLDTNVEVRHALVLMPKSGPCKKKLVAILSLNSFPAVQSSIDSSFELVGDHTDIAKANAKISEIQDLLSTQLPPFMIPQLWIPVKTIHLLPSGKLDRKRATSWLESLDETTFDQINTSSDEDSSVPAQQMEATDTLRRIWANVLNLDVKDVKSNKSFMSLGGDSITAMSVMSQCRKENIELTLHDVLRSKSVVHLANCVGHKVSGPQKEETLNELFGLSPIQQLYFKSARAYSGDSRFNQSFTLRIAKRTDSSLIKLAIEAIVDKHSMLRARFVREGASWRQKITKDINTSYRYRVHENVRKYGIPDIIEDAQKCLNIERGPILAAEVFNNQNDSQFLFMAIHHVSVDVVSWRIILQDLQEFLETKSLTVDKPLSFQTWCSLQADNVKTQDASALLPFQVTPSNLAYWGMESKENTYFDAEYQSFQLDKSVTALALGDSHKPLQTEPIDLFLAAIAHSFCRVFSDREVPTLYNEGHGRETWEGGPDLSRTVGWFTSICPITVPISLKNGKDDVLDTLRRVKDLRRNVPGNGRPYFANKYSVESSKIDESLPMEIIFNYLGRMQQLERDDSLLQQADLITEEEDSRIAGDVGPTTIRFALFEISAMVLQNHIRFTFMFNRNMKRTQEIRRWVSECKRTLQRTVEAMSRCTAEPTLSDYPLLPISYDALKKLVKTTFPRVGVASPDQVEDIYPCSPMQEGILLSQLRDPESYVFNTSFKVRCAQSFKHIDARALGEAWQKVVNRHAALRTIFIDSPCRGATFCQLVVKEVDSGVIYLTSGSSNAMEELSSIKLKDTNGNKRPQLPHQLAICSKPDGSVVIKFEINHAVIDGGSVSIMVSDLIAAYENRLPVGQAPLYSDYIRFIRSQDTANEIKFWKTYLKGINPCYLTNLHSVAHVQKQLHETHVMFNRYKDLQDLCEQQKVTMANIMHAAWAVVLKIYTKSDDVCFGYLSAGRDAPVNGIQETIGAFINMLCCRVQFSPNASFIEIFRKVQDDYLDSLPYQRCSLAEVQHELGLSGKALYNTALSIQNHANNDVSSDQSIIFEHIGGHDPSEYAVTVNIETARDDEGILLRHWNNAVSKDEAQKLASTMADVLASFIEHPNQLLADFNPSKSTKPAIVDDTNDGNLAYLAHRGSKSTAPQLEVNHGTGAPLNTEQLLNNNAELRKVVDTCVQDIIQKMIESGQLTTKNTDDVLLNSSQMPARNILEDPRNFGFDNSLHSEHGREMNLETATPSESYQNSDYNPKNDVDRTSMATHIKKRGRSAHVEKKLLALWSSMLEIEEDSISGEDSFFELGGDSLTAMRLVGAARDEGLSLTVADVFRSPVFEDMVAIIRVASMMNTYIDGDDMDDFKAQSQAIRSAATSELYQRFSLVKAPNIDAFLQNNIIPKVGVFKGGMADVLPVTDFQALAITGSLLESRWMLNYFFLDGHGVIDLRRLKRSFIRLVHSIDILRTVFLPSGERFLQIVLRKMRPDFFVYETESTLDEFTNMLRQRDREQGPRLGEAFVNFTVVKEKDSDHHRIIIRLSHAQYDGVCMPKILSAIQAGYEDEPLPAMSSFASYVRASAATIGSDHYQHWKTLLKGSKMTEIVRREGPNYRRSAGATNQLKQTILLPSIAHGNITTATVIKAAWAMVLAQLSGSPDVVFGHTISGRNATIPGVESTVGPCLNIIPVRVQFGEFWTALDLLRFVQDQQVTNMAYEALGFREITKHCTEWPDWTNFTTVVQHQNAGITSEMTLGRNTYTVGAAGTQEDFADFSVLSTLSENDKCEIALGFSLNSSITPLFAQKVLNMLCNTISNFMADTSMALLSPQQISKMPPQTIDETGRADDSYFLSSQLQDLTQAEILVLSDILSRAWRQVLGEENTASLNLESSFFDLNGDIMGLAQVAWLLEQEGFKVRVEDLIDHPTMLGQMATICSQKSLEKEKVIEASSSQTSIEEVYETIVHPKSEKNSWFKALGMARRMVKRNTRPS